MAPPRIFIGAGGWGSPNFGRDVVEEFAAVLKELGIREIDTAARYGLGASEKVIGETQLHEKNFVIDSKVLMFGDGSGTMTTDAVEKSATQTLESLGMEKVNILYCHAPDRTTPIAEQAAAMDAQYKAGRFAKLGVSNFPPDMLKQWLDIAEEKDYVKPSVFQGQYNLLCRESEQSLFPLLREHKIAFVGYSPLAGGVLTGKLTFSTTPEDLKGTRFEVKENNFGGAIYRSWYDKPEIHDAVRTLADLCKQHDVATSDAAVRWLLHHSALNGGNLLDSANGDAIIIGPRTMEQLKGYADAIGQGPLPEELVKGLDQLWEGVRGVWEQ
ncbi:aldehyde reductase [Polyplosphaeria fusca]|uniref:Aldehyde reductase n=1 Tax=Polyplosphaeria fusca TaxID=682080 RepID=A0A9P4QW59_9PLEO|nr:aldehyde reductase [Polyplosphaeria fusca]